MATTTNYSWSTPDDTALVKDGASAIRTLGSSVDSTLGTALNNKLHAGLVLISATSIGSGVASVSLTSPFSATYDSYKIVLTNCALSSAGSNLHWQLAASGTQATTNYSYGIAAMDYAANSFNYIRGQNTSQIVSGMVVTANNVTSTTFDLLNPFATNPTIFSGLSFVGNSAGYAGMGAGYHSTATSYNGLRLSVSSGTLTGGVVAVYGYAKD
jgi:hypothetical protein